MRKLKYIFERFSNLFSWFNVIWKDEQYSPNYIYIILKKKLERMRCFYENQNNVHQIDQSRLSILRYVNISIVLIEKLLEDDFLAIEDSKMIERLGVNWIKFDVDSFEIKHKEEINGIYNRAEIKRQKTKHLLFLIIEKRIDYWWD